MIIVFCDFCKERIKETSALLTLTVPKVTKIPRTGDYPNTEVSFEEHVSYDNYQVCSNCSGKISTQLEGMKGTEEKEIC